MKGLGLSPREVVYEISYANLILLGASLPSYGSGEGESAHDALRADEASEADVMSWMKEANTALTGNR